MKYRSLQEWNRLDYCGMVKSDENLEFDFNIICIFSIGNHEASMPLSERLGEPRQQLHKEFQILSEERR